MRIVFGASLTALLAFAPLGAEAKYSLCNKTSYALEAAIGYVDGDRLATRGWWLLRPGQCKVVLTETTGPGRYFVYAEGIPGHKGPLRSWSGDTPLCVEESGFFNLRNQEICRDDPTRQRGFFDVEVTPAAGGNWQTDFVESANYTVYNAQVAGVQRLLQDIGRGGLNIDGAPSSTMRNLIVGYRREKGLPDTTEIDDSLIDALIADANGRDSKTGLFYCNKSTATLWTAIAIPSDRSYTSKGWWKLEPAQCAKIVKGELTHNHYYVFGLTEDGRSERRIAGGDKSFCINAVKFEIDNARTCADLDYDEAMFRRFDIGSATSTTFEFKDEMFVPPPTQ